MTVSLSTAANNARLAGLVSFADLGSAHSKIQFFGAGVLLAEVVLTKPCGAVVSDALVLVQEDPVGDQVTTEGVADSGVWINGNGDEVASGDVSDESGAGFFKLRGTSGTTLYGGANVQLGVSAIV